ncbi:hypothetical protein AB0G73_10740 [Streptomyces sp. NPDC020719]|uniref:hypothetical protein n=1 Tax=Streptomyces sp. NPDC020719 TaxID=3154896 RepID=UPI0033D0DE70
MPASIHPDVDSELNMRAFKRLSAVLSRRKSPRSFVPVDPLRHAITDLADMLERQGVAEGIGVHLNCDEVDQIARILILGGHPETAALLIECHAVDDDQEEVHYQGPPDINIDGEPVVPVSLAVYVAALA